MHVEIFFGQHFRILLFTQSVLLIPKEIDQNIPTHVNSRRDLHKVLH